MAEKKDEQGLLSLPYMVRWFSPTLLASAAVRAAVSPVFGTFADTRSTHANVDGFDPEDLRRVAKRYDLSQAGIEDESGAVWIDYLADTADGFDATYAVATLAAQEHLTVSRAGSKEKHELPAGKLVIFGGDQVYPYPTRDEYRNRFEYPFAMAFSDLTRPRFAFVIPGNHDWYDGLNSFDFLFCQARYGEAGGRQIGALRFTQHRSYFAIKLPHNWWIWGSDMQFSDYLDSGQTRYFEAVANRMRELQPGEPEHKVILCTAAPGWQYEEAEARAALSNIRIVVDLIEDAGGKVCGILSGDTHHYSRYYSKATGLNLVTAGGGGAFLHPTHQLYNKIKFHWQREDQEFELDCRPTVKSGGTKCEPAVYPSRAQSFWLTWGNLLFPFWNYTFSSLLGVFYWLMTWMYSQTPVGRTSCMIGTSVERRPLVEDILIYNNTTCGLKGDTAVAWLQDLISVTVQAGIYQFLLGIFGLGLWVACVMYADAKRRWKKVVMGTFHWLAHIVAMIALYIVVNKFGYWRYLGEWTKGALFPVVGQSVNILQTVAYMVQMIFGGGIVAGFVWGFYLFSTCAFGKRHTNDAFSAIRNPDYKNFLRMKLEPDRLTIYPIGIWRTPTRIEWRMRPDPATGKEKYSSIVPLSAELIDGPVVVEAAAVSRLKPLHPVPGAIPETSPATEKWT